MNEKDWEKISINRTFAKELVFRKYKKASRLQNSFISDKIVKWLSHYGEQNMVENTSTILFSHFTPKNLSEK